MVTSQKWRLSSVVSFHLKTSLLATVVGLHKLVVFLEVVAPRSYMLAPIPGSTVCASVHEEGL